MKIEKLNDFNQVIKYYKEILKFAKDLRPNISKSELKKFMTEFDVNNVGEFYKIS